MQIDDDLTPASYQKHQPHTKAASFHVSLTRPLHTLPYPSRNSPPSHTATTTTLFTVPSTDTGRNRQTQPTFSPPRLTLKPSTKQLTRNVPLLLSWAYERKFETWWNIKSSLTTVDRRRQESEDHLAIIKRPPRRWTSHLTTANQHEISSFSPPLKKLPTSERKGKGRGKGKVRISNPQCPKLHLWRSFTQVNAIFKKRRGWRGVAGQKRWHNKAAQVELRIDPADHGRWWWWCDLNSILLKTETQNRDLSGNWERSRKSTLNRAVSVVSPTRQRTFSSRGAILGSWKERCRSKFPGGGGGGGAASVEWRRDNLEEIYLLAISRKFG